MSFYRNLVTAIAAMGLASAVFAADDMANTDATPAQPAATTTAEAQQAAPAADATASDKVNLNKATAKELAKVKGLNASKAKAIVIYRKKHGDFKAVEDLKEVKGFKKMDEKTLKDIEDQLTVG
jgi:competence protein ComEA